MHSAEGGMNFFRGMSALGDGEGGNFAKKISDLMREFHTVLLDGGPGGAWHVYAGADSPTHLYVVPRERVALIRELKDVEKCPALYILMGRDEQGNDLAYIGQTLDPYTRFACHRRSWKWWHKVLIFVSASHAVFSDDVRFLEHLAIARALELGRMPIYNSVVPAAEARSECRAGELRNIFGDIVALAAFSGCPVLMEAEAETTDDEWTPAAMEAIDSGSQWAEERRGAQRHKRCSEVSPRGRSEDGGRGSNSGAGDRGPPEAWRVKDNSLILS